MSALVAAGCGGAAKTRSNPNPEPEPDAGGGIADPPPKLDASTPTTLADGQKCTQRTQCESGFCVEGICCDSACTGTCKACNVAGSIGRCSDVPEGEDPRNHCNPQAATTCGNDGMCDGAGACRKQPAGTECAAASCTGMTESSNRQCDGTGKCMAPTTKTCTQGCTPAGICPAPCSTMNPCQAGLYCDPTAVCKPKKTMGQACASGDECGSTFCVDGVCCGSACMGTCQACNLPGAVGNCTPVPLNQDPNTECPADLAAPCGRSGGCNGAGACAVRENGFPCGGGMTCSGTTESLRACNGMGTCVSVNPRSCAPYRCQGTSCGVTCFSNFDCAPGNTCQGGACQGGGGSVMGGELLHWQFDETSTTTTIADDSSGLNHQGTYTGNGGERPTPSTNVPNIGVTNPRSRAFDRDVREAVQLAVFPQDLRPANDMTLAVWYRATTVDTNGSELISGGDSFFLRLRTGSIEFGKRIDNGTGGSTFVGCRVNRTGHLNGQWHHVAGVTTTAGMTLYFDGQEICSNGQGGDIVYNRGNDLWVGRHGFNETTWDFEGNIDDVRIFGRELTADDVRALAGATPGAADIVLHWRLDETSTTNTNVDDASGNNYDGDYIGNNGNLPDPSTDAAPIGVTNPRSRNFNRANREAVQRVGMPTAIKPRNDLTVSVWYKANSTDTSGAELVSAGDNYSVRLRPGQLEFSKRTNDTGIAHWVQCFATVNNHLNNQWHHVAAVTSPDGMVLYLDGQEVCNNGEGGDIIYDQGNNLLVGRHGNNQTNWDYQGLIDDVRIYGRALQANEVQDLFGGTRPQEVILQWKMDETSTTTTTALDSSGANLNGSYLGTTGHPMPSTDVPATLNGLSIRSRQFTRANRHYVRLQNMPFSLKLPNDFSVSAWYKSGALGGQTGEEIVSAGNSYLLRVRTNQIEFTKRTSAGFAQCIGDFPQANDNQWHHVVGVTSGTGMNLYVDGNLVLNNARTETVVYDATADFVVGRHPTGLTWDFEGNIDDVRVYGRALTDADITAIYSGQQ